MHLVAGVRGPGPGDVARQMVVDTVVFGFWEAAGAFVGLHEMRSVAADEPRPQAGDAIGVHVPVTHSEHTPLRGIATNAGDLLVASGDFLVGCMNGHHAEAGTSFDRSRRLHLCHREGPGVVVVPQASATRFENSPARREGQGRRIAAVPTRAGTIDLRPAPQPVRGQVHGLAHAVGQLDRCHHAGGRLLGQLDEALRDLPLAVRRGPSSGDAALPVDVPHEGGHCERRAGS
mmetsp:Transcript_26821/g.76804  ORF Transcript_26821/g.76804 Transcript_26821/m.76804 type:complete len:232 (+) Transcript_26821:225-920(+)